MTTKFFLQELDLADSSPKVPGGVHTYKIWERWLSETIPRDIDNHFRANARKHLRLVLTGLEMKFGLILAHKENSQPLLYEPYLWSLVFETCVATYSFLEGLGVAIYLNGLENPPAVGQKINQSDWVIALKSKWMSNYKNFDNDFEVLKNGRDRIFQNKLSSPVAEDYLEFDTKVTFLVAQRMLNAVFDASSSSIAYLPEATNLRSANRP